MRPLHICFAILVAAIWGGNFVAAKYGVMHFPPFLLTSFRFCVTAALLLPFVARPTNAQLRHIALLSLVLGTLHFALLFAALYHQLDISASALVGQLGVPFSCLFGAIFLKDRLGPWRLAGMAIAFAGISVVAGTPNILEHPLAFACALGAALAWGMANIVMKRIEGVQIFQLLAWLSVLTVPQLWLISALLESGQLALIASAPASAWLSVAYTSLMSTIAAYGLWYFLLQAYPVTMVAPFSLLTPVFGIAFGQLFFAEQLTWQVIIGGLTTIAGVAIIVVRRPKVMAMGEAT